MEDFANYVYIFGPVLWALLAFVGGLVIAISPKSLRQARIWLVLSAIPLFAVPIAFGLVAHSMVLGLVVATASGFVLGMIYYQGISILNEHIGRTDEDSSTNS
jgi:hypothetical protein